MIVSGATAVMLEALPVFLLVHVILKSMILSEF